MSGWRKLKQRGEWLASERVTTLIDRMIAGLRDHGLSASQRGKSLVVRGRGLRRRWLNEPLLRALLRGER